MSASREAVRRNPGPSWGYAFMLGLHRLTPWPVMLVCLRIGSFFAMCGMPEERRYSKRFLANVLGRPTTWRDSWKHFTTFSEFLIRRFDCAGGREPQFESEGGSMERLRELTANKRQALHGTFHFGNSDLMGFWLSDFDVSLKMLRYQVGNSNDLKWLEARYGDSVGFLWVNQPEDLLFQLKDAVDSGHSIALKCDRVEHSSKREVFEFLGERRLFPFTVYHLSILFDLPVLFSFGVAVEQNVTRIYSSSIFYPTGANKREKMTAARAHFQETLHLLERLVREYPYQWFNFFESSPVVEDEA